MEEKFKELAGLFVSQMAESGVQLGYDAPSVEWADGFVERQRARFTGGEEAGLVNVVGAFLGECVIASYGGRWRADGGAWAVYFDDSHAADPFSKVQKQFDNGREGGDSIYSFYTLIPVLFKRASDAQ
ncbi:MAG TPA: hypothetical protein VEQ42_01025 [Pyrinomonadaceae bacterium]|nr:hypothetical protein [Pyrinomonadaceae bacterium]